MKRALLILGLPACTTPTPQLRIGYSAGPAQACPSAQCQDITLPCESVMSIRIVDPGDPNPDKPALAQCERVSPNGSHSACSINSINLAATALPVKDLEVQLAVYPLSSLPVDALCEPICPTIQYNASTGFPVEQAPAPTLGGRAYYHPGDTYVDVTLGCTDLSMVEAASSCSATKGDTVSATVVDFFTRVQVSVGPAGVADRLIVSVGEPHQLHGTYQLTPRDAVALRRAAERPPRWAAATTQTFMRYACVEVLEDGGQTTPTLRCVPADHPLPELTGVWLASDKLAGILSQLPDGALPPEGVTIGMVVDELARGASGYRVTASTGDPISYLSKAGSLDGEATSESGIFLSRNAPFGTMFSAFGSSATEPAVGGLVAGKVTVVLVPFSAASRR